jgi:hypothetical protein
MTRARRLTTALFLGVSFLLVGCADLPTAPQPEATQPEYGLLGSLTGGLLGSGSSEVTVLRRTVPLAEDEVVSKVIGPWGGVIYLRRAGLTVTVPWGALDSYTRITVTAPAGNLVGYHFAPHGLEFDRSVTVSQSLLQTEGLGLLSGLSAAYFEGELEPTVTALEILPLWLLRLLGIFQIDHFSGYVIATN